MSNPKQYVRLLQRAQEFYQTHRRQASRAGLALDYRLGDILYFVLNNLGERHCHFCRGPVEGTNFFVEHKVPPERGGRFIFHNLAVVCPDCHAAKGPLDHFEFRELMALVDTWALSVRNNFITRLKAGSKVLGRRSGFPA